MVKTVGGEGIELGVFSSQKSTTQQDKGTNEVGQVAMASHTFGSISHKEAV